MRFMMIMFPKSYENAKPGTGDNREQTERSQFFGRWKLVNAPSVEN
jgi:hypothetical protein